MNHEPLRLLIKLLIEIVSLWLSFEAFISDNSGDDSDETVISTMLDASIHILSLVIRTLLRLKKSRIRQRHIIFDGNLRTEEAFTDLLIETFEKSQRLRMSIWQILSDSLSADVKVMERVSLRIQRLLDVVSQSAVTNEDITTTIMTSVSQTVKISRDYRGKMNLAPVKRSRFLPLSER